MYVLLLFQLSTLDHWKRPSPAEAAAHFTSTVPLFRSFGFIVIAEKETMNEPLLRCSDGFHFVD